MSEVEGKACKEQVKEQTGEEGEGMLSTEDSTKELDIIISELNGNRHL